MQWDSAAYLRFKAERTQPSIDLVKRIDWQDDQSLHWAIEHLRHDEHINAATLSGILNYAFCIQLSDSGGNP